ncbi:MAG: hypothetical protein ABH840_02840 [Nanoarchaeota archaeon]
MDKRNVIIGISALLLVILFFSGFFKITNFAVNDQKLLVSLDIPPDQQKIKPGQNLLLKIFIRVLNANIDQTSIIELDYSIKDLDGNLISSKKESGAIAVKESEVTSLLIPSNTKAGVYSAFVAVNYEGEVYEASKTFEVTNNEDNLSIVIYILIGLILVLILFIVIKKIRDKFYY